MAQPHSPRRPGEGLELRAQDKFFNWMFLMGSAGAAVTVCIGEWVGHFLGTRWPLASTCGAVLFTTLTCIVIGRDYQPVVRMLRGARGERDVGEILDELRTDGYSAVHGFPIHAIEDGRPVGDVDHVLIGPGGVFAIETKRLSRKQNGKMPKVAFDGSRVTVDGRLPDRDPVAQARRAAIEISRIVEIKTGRTLPVRAVVVYPGCWVDSAPVGEIGVINPKQLFGWVRLQPTVLKRADVDLIRHVLIDAAASREP